MHIYLKGAPALEQSPAATRSKSTQINLTSVIYGLIAIGVFFRLYHYLDNRSFWIDEIFLATSFVNMSFWEMLTMPLENEQKAPVGYIILTKIFVMLFGPNEMALRLLSLLSGILTLFAFVPVARHFIMSRLGVVLAVGVIALSPPIIYHSVEAKQYSTGLLCSVLALLCFVKFHQNVSIKSLLTWGLYGSLLLWFSFSMMFVLGGMAIALSLYYMYHKDWKRIAYLLIPFSIWLVTVVLNYFLFLQDYQDSSWLVAWFRNRNGFMPLPPTSLQELMWFVNRPFSLLDYPLGLSWFQFKGENPLLQVLYRMSLIPFALLVLGVIIQFRSSKKIFWVFLSPIMLHLLAAGVEAYPFFERLTVYLAPILIILIANACIVAVKFIADKWRNSTSVKYALPIFLLVGPVYNSVLNIVDQDTFGGSKNWHQRELFMYINKHYKPGDAVYIYWNAKYPYQFYGKAYPLRFKAIEGNDYRFKARSMEEYQRKVDADIQALKKYDRVWLIYADYLGSHIGEFEFQPEWYYRTKMDVEQLPAKFSQFGKPIDSFRTKEDMDAILFDIEDDKLDHLGEKL
ncbi:glycosyltransferase family 39 protein [Pedobacter sp. SYSU D00535]|uniref:glycosyltransferase family 39 protein n=1 Tax=Pedobacter sp. SYSU D00535 TaxID=2810308 RepID=UPI001A9621C1|nr:glycosyltransferase family 39 protein [Pedobacter sp. SYSU D00535]